MVSFVCLDVFSQWLGSSPGFAHARLYCWATFPAWDAKISASYRRTPTVTYLRPFRASGRQRTAIDLNTRVYERDPKGIRHEQLKQTSHRHCLKYRDTQLCLASGSQVDDRPTSTCEPRVCCMDPEEIIPVSRGFTHSWGQSTGKAENRVKLGV